DLHTLGIDLPGEKPGLVPTSDFYTKRYGSDKWRSGFNISLSIGQGELGITPLQMANLMAIVANRGHYYRPHLIKGIGDKKIAKPEFTEKIFARSEEHTSELQSRENLVCRLLLEKKKNKKEQKSP